MTEAVLLKARCSLGHEWDVWGEVDDTGRTRANPGDAVCPTCYPERLAVELEEADSLA